MLSRVSRLPLTSKSLATKHYLAYRHPHPQQKQWRQYSTPTPNPLPTQQPPTIQHLRAVGIWHRNNINHCCRLFLFPCSGSVFVALGFCLYLQWWQCHHRGSSVRNWEFGDYQSKRVRTVTESNHQVQSQRDRLPALDISNNQTKQQSTTLHIDQSH
jgi:hypothetical protein